MPRLLSLNSYQYRRGGSDVVFLEHDALFREHGWDTAVFSMHHPQNVSSPWSEYFVDEIEFGHHYGLTDKVLRASKVIYSFEAERKLGRLLDGFDADIAHVHCIYHHLSPSVLCELKRRGIPTVMTAHDLKLVCPAYKMVNRTGVCERCKGGNLSNVIWHRCVRDSFAVSSLVAVESSIHRLFGLWRKNLDRIVVPSRFFSVKLQEWGWSGSVLECIPNFVRAREYPAKFECGDYFLYFGRLAPEKGVGTLIKAAICSGVEVRIVGSGPAQKELQSLARNATNVQFLGYRVGEELRALVRGARAVVLPSEWYENAPMSVLEACAYGKPIIGARIGGIPEMVVEGETGFLFSSGNVEELTETLRRVWRKSAYEIEQLGRAARSLVEREFNERRYLNSILDLYSRLGVAV